MTERRPIPSLPGYFATIDGDIIGPDGRQLPLCRTYPRVQIRKADSGAAGSRRHPVHRLVAEAFHGPRPPGADIDHIDRDGDNSRPDNLRYLDAAINRANPNQNTRKTHCPKGHPYDAENTTFTRGRRYCRTCHREHMRRSREEKAERVRTLFGNG